MKKILTKPACFALFRIGISIGWLLFQQGDKILDPLYSRLWYRVICALAIFLVSAWYLLRYASKVKKDPSKSLVVMTGLHKRVLLLFGSSVVLMIYAMLQLKFGMAELAAYFMFVGVLISG